MQVTIQPALDQLVAWANNNLAGNRQLLGFEQMMAETGVGIYVVYDDEHLLYVGKTTRSGKVRIREMASDYRSHTLNRKLMTNLLERAGVSLKGSLKKDSKRELIQDKAISGARFEQLQFQVNAMVRGFKFLFVPCEGDLERMEHWAIALLDPPLND